MFAGLNSLNNCPLSLRTAREVCSELRGVSVDVRNTPGTYIQNTSTGKVVYTPPVGAEVIRDKMSGWETFINTASELDPLVVMALSHYQFEAIHPFSDGNGRTGRVLNILFLVQNELLTLPVLYLSRYIIKHKSDYYAALNRVTADGDWDGWIKFMLNAVCDTSVWTREKVLGIRRMEEETIVRMHEVQELKKIYSRELVDVIFSLPYVRIQNLIDKGIVQRQAASKYLNILARHGILKEMPSAKEKLFVNTRLLDLLKSE
jgi:Fic family protein